MPLIVNLRHLERKNLELEGEIEAAELELEGLDPLIKVSKAIKYELEIQRLETSVLAHGWVAADLDCECARCLKPFSFRIELESWACHLPLEGEEAVKADGDFIDLTPFIREDIILGFPQHPVCGAGCAGSESLSASSERKAGSPGADESASPWTVLNQLKLKK